MKSILTIVATLLLANTAFSADQVYSATLRSDGSTGIKFSIPYKAGIHKGSSSEVKGLVVTDENDQLISAKFAVPIGSLTTNNASRDCHMRESLGIDYTNSNFPKKHVCDSDNVIPKDGPDSVVYPEILLSFNKFEVAPGTPFQVGKSNEAQVQATVEIHGVAQEMTIPLKVIKSEPQVGKSVLQITGKFSVLLADFGIIVKPFKLGPIEIGVGDKATVEVDLIVVK